MRVELLEGRELLACTGSGLPEAELFFAVAKNGTVGAAALAVSNEDVIAYDGSTFCLVLDGSDVGLTAFSIDAFDVLSSTEILLSFTAPGTIPGIAVTTDDSDIVKFTATGLGTTTAGSFSMYFDASDVGLSSSGEDVDAVMLLDDGRIVISTAGRTSTGAHTAEDEDLSAFTATLLGTTTAGSWEMYFDGSDVGLTSSSEDIGGASEDAGGNIYLATSGNFSVTGVSGTKEAVFVFVPSTLGAATAGTYQSTLFFEGSAFGLGGNTIAGIDIPDGGGLVGPQYTVMHEPRVQLGDAPLDGYAGSSTDQIVLMWQAVPAGSGTSDSFVAEYRLSVDTAWTDAGPTSTLDTGVEDRINHSVEIAGLDYDTDYDYRVQHLRAGSLVTEYQATFHTRLAAGDTAPFSFVAYGDSANLADVSGFRDVQSRINTIAPAFSLLLGDNAYESGTHSEADARFDPSVNPEAAAWIASHVDYFSFGNHDSYTSDGQPSIENFAVPVPVSGVTAPAAPPASETDEHNYSFDYGDVHFATYDSNAYDDATRLDGLLDWLEADMAASLATWKIVFVHHPVAGVPDKPESPADNYYQQVVPRLNAAGVDLLLTGHSHTFSWTYPLIDQSGGTATFVLDTDKNYTKGVGLVQAVAGVGGDSIRSGDYSVFPFVAEGFTTSTSPAVEFGFAQIDVTTTQLTLKYVAADNGAVIDQFSITDAGLPIVKVTATAPAASESGPGTGTFTVTRTGSTASSLTVSYSMSGTAGNGSDYSELFGSVTIDAGNSSATVTVTPENDMDAEGDETVILSISADATYTVGAPPSATVTIEDNDTLFLKFQQGVASYTGTADTFLQEGSATANNGSATELNADLDDPVGSFKDVQALILFDNLFGAGAGQIPLGSTIVSATLDLEVTNEGSAISLYRMLQTWSESSTWNSLSSGVQTNDVEAESSPDATTGSVPIGVLSIDVTASVEAWAAATASNFGWVVLSTGFNGVDFYSSEGTTPPVLTVEYFLS